MLEEVTLLAEAGLSPLEALQAATLNPAKFFRATDSLGTVATGKLADLVLLDANPVTDIRNLWTIRAVVANGRYFDRAALDTLDKPGREKNSIDDLATYGRLLAPPILGALSNGVAITEVEANSAAEAAGLKVGDTILTINGKPIESSSFTLSQFVKSCCKARQTIIMELLSGSAHRTVNVELREAR